MSATGWSAAAKFSRGPRVSRTRQHSVFSRYPTFGSLITKMRRQLVFDRRGADDARIAHLDQRRTFRIAQKAGRDPDGTQVVGRAIVGAKKLSH
jgi:hypothetical protein